MQRARLSPVGWASAHADYLAIAPGKKATFQHTASSSPAHTENLKRCRRSLTESAPHPALLNDPLRRAPRAPKQGSNYEFVVSSYLK
jgi:hypothetical protein